MDPNVSNTSKDPRCPVCGNAVLGYAVHGHEGAYHPECAQAPARMRDSAPVVVPVYVPTPWPWWHNPGPTWDVQITCNSNRIAFDDCSAPSGPLHLVN